MNLKGKRRKSSPLVIWRSSSPEPLEVRCLLHAGVNELPTDVANSVGHHNPSCLDATVVLSSAANKLGSLETATETVPVGLSCCCAACRAVADLSFAEMSEASPSGGEGGPSLATVPLSSVPVLNSLAGAAVSLYLNFVGRFDAFWGSYSNVSTPAFDQDGDPTSFSNGELDAIQTIWSIVAEDYAPFNVNVTTVAPPTLANGVAVSIAIGGNGSWTGGTYAGISYTDSFTSFMPNVGFVFSSNVGNNPKSVGDAASHEAGHTFGLLHQSQYDAGGNLIREYSTGPGDGRAPIMGNSHAATRGLWWNGPTASATTFQDDMAVIARSANGFGYRTDDHGNTVANATSLSVTGNQVTGSGIIETTSDLDYFAFSTAAGQITLSVNVLPAGINNLDARLELRDAADNLIASAAPTDTFSATITTTVAAGNYRLVVASQGNYGDVGQYSVNGSLQVNHAPSGTNRTIGITAGMPYSLTASDFGFSDPLDVPADQFLAVRISTLPMNGTLALQAVPVVVGQYIATTAIDAGWLKFVPTAESAQASISFQVQDDGGTASGGVDLDPTANTLTLTWGHQLPSAVIDRQLFYNNSYYDGYDVSVGASDDFAVAIDKRAYIPTGATATFESVSSFSKGLNGLMIDLDGGHGELTLGDFEFRVGNDNSPQTWMLAPQPLAISIRNGAGLNGSDRIEIIWADNAVKNQWLQVTLKANSNTRLAFADIFYFGHALGESGIDNAAGLLIVNTTDYLAPLNNPRTVFDNMSITNTLDYNRDGVVNTTDAIIARNNPTSLSNSLRLITVSVSTAAATTSYWAAPPESADTGAEEVTFCQSAVAEYDVPRVPNRWKNGLHHFGIPRPLNPRTWRT